MFAKIKHTFLKKPFIPIGILLLSLVLTIIYLQRQQNVQPKATAPICASTTANTPVDQTCIDGVLMKTYEYADNNICKLFYEASDASCQGNASPTPKTVTPTAKPTIASSPTLTTASPTPTIKPTTPTISPSPTLTAASPTPTNQPVSPQFTLTFSIPGLTNNPIHTTKPLILMLVGAQGTNTVTDTAVFSGNTNNFSKTILVNQLPEGIYSVTITSENMLQKTLENISLSPGKITSIPQIVLLQGDSNMDNKLDIIDYNILVSCFGEKQQSESCNPKDQMDLTDDGVIDGNDYNIFIRNLNNSLGK